MIQKSQQFTLFALVLAISFYAVKSDNPSNCYSKGKYNCTNKFGECVDDYYQCANYSYQCYYCVIVDGPYQWCGSVSDCTDLSTTDIIWICVGIGIFFLFCFLIYFGVKKRRQQQDQAMIQRNNQLLVEEEQQQNNFQTLQDPNAINSNPFQYNANNPTQQQYGQQNYQYPQQQQQQFGQQQYQQPYQQPYQQ